MKTLIKGNSHWVGKVDWELRKFHGDEYSTHRGSSYNSYLVSEKKTALIDTIWRPFAKEYIENLAKETDLERIDYVIANHGETDHSGALPELLEKIPEKPVYCTANGVKSLKGHYHKDWNFKVVKTGDRLDLGNGRELVFIEAPMLHWPDTMMTYLTGDNILFSNDAFGQHYATEFLFNDLVDQEELYTEAVKYYANILTPFSEFVTKKIGEVLGFKLPVDVIAPSHGIIWRQNPGQIIETYLKWAADFQEDKITIFYDTMWNGTRRLAEEIAKGIHSADPKTDVRLFNSSSTDKNDIITEIFRSKAVVVGSPTINRTVLTSVAALLDQMKGLRFKRKKAAAFGCYGWSGESVKIISEHLKESGFEVVTDGLKAFWNPDKDALAQAGEFGRLLAEKFK